MFRRYGAAGRRSGRGSITGGAPVAWSPLLDAGLQAWYDPSDPAYRTLDGSDRFHVLADKGPLGREATQNSGGNRPTLSTLGGRDALGLDGARWLRGAWASSLSTPYMSIVVADVTGASGSHVLCANASTNTSGTIFFDSGSWRASSGVTLDSGDTTRNGLRAHALIGGASGAYYLDDFGTAIVSGNAGTTAANGRTIGRNQGTFGTVVGLIGDHIVTTSSDATTRALYAAWLTARYTGLTVTT